MCQVPVNYLAFIVHVEDCRVSQLLFIRAQRADKVAEAFGQHRYGAVDQVNACGTLYSLLVDNVAFLHVV